ncbi:hypothetical protein EBZ35_02580 [bacterium]|nr:hypothetical protein [bacterium]
MDVIQALFDRLIHLDQNLLWLVETYHQWAYWILGLIVFLENGVVLAPFLPGDSLVLVCGTLGAAGVVDLLWLSTILTVAAIVGSTFNYVVGYYCADLVRSGRMPLVKMAHIEKTQAYFDRYGAVTIAISKFLPIVRTFAPFLSGMGRMNFWKFSVFNVLGSLVWVAVFASAGYYFSQIPFVRDHLVMVVMGILVVSVAPVLIQLWRSRSFHHDD